MNRTEYLAARRTYRDACHADCTWSPGNYIPTARNSVAPVRPTTAADFLRSLPPRVAECLRPSPMPSGRLPMGPRARAFCAPRRTGMGANLNLAQRVALRRALRDTRAFDAKILSQRAEAEQVNLRA